MGRYKIHVITARLIDLIPRNTDNNIKCVKYNKTILTLLKKQNKNAYYGHGSTILCALLLLPCLSGLQD